MDLIHAANMDETYGTFIDDECFDIHDSDDDTDHDTDDDTDDDADDATNDDTDADADDGGRGNLYPIKAQGSRTLSGQEWAS
mgnify:CR=1 FL=1